MQLPYLYSVVTLLVNEVLTIPIVSFSGESETIERILKMALMFIKDRCAHIHTHTHKHMSILHPSGLCPGLPG